MSTYKTYRLNMEEIQASLLEVQRDFSRLSEAMLMRREPLDNRIIDNLLAGYAYVDQLLEEEVDLFTLKGSDHILELNHIVLCGLDERVRLEFGPHILETRKRFSQGIGQILSWYARKKSKSAYKRAAGVYVLGVSQPQLFLEGNHRTGSLLASFILVKDGKPPFVLTRENALAYFNPSTLIKYKHKQKFLDMQYFLKKYMGYFTEFLEKTLDKRFRRKILQEDQKKTS
ncbi:hypothetical protein [Desulfolutivibrio sp.]|uniref:hypothetical protein n=1 Tax=Desulfolutivibrio sp. TaxID=2773296 RepID=UPI002F963BEF